MKASRLGTFCIATPRRAGEGLRIGTVRYLPRGVPKRDYATRDYFDVWFQTVAPSRELIRWLRSRPWTRAPEAARALELLAAISKQTPRLCT